MSREGLAAMRTAVHGDHEWAVRLRATDAGAFRSTVLLEARSRGFPVDDTDLDDAIRANRIAWDLRFTADPPACDTHDLRDPRDDAAIPARLDEWTPAHIYQGTSYAIEWVLADGTFPEPFFIQTIERARQHPFNTLFSRRTSIDALDSLSPGVDEPAGFIFHESRCGSTLVAQMLTALPGAAVISEAPPIDALLRAGTRAGADEVVTARRLRALIGAVGPRTVSMKRYVKFHAWHVLLMPFFRRAFPDVPWLFLFREPREVLDSHARSRNVELLPGSIDRAYLADIAEPADESGFETYGAGILAALCDAALRDASGARAFVDYASLPGSVFATILPLFKVEPNVDTIAEMRRLALLDTKGAATPFAQSPPIASRAIDFLATTYLDRSYAELRLASENPSTGSRSAPGAL